MNGTELYRIILPAASLFSLSPSPSSSPPPLPRLSSICCLLFERRHEVYCCLLLQRCVDSLQVLRYKVYPSPRSRLSRSLAVVKTAGSISKNPCCHADVNKCGTMDCDVWETDRKTLWRLRMRQGQYLLLYCNVSGMLVCGTRSAVQSSSNAFKLPFWRFSFRNQVKKLNILTKILWFSSFSQGQMSYLLSIKSFLIQLSPHR